MERILPLFPLNIVSFPTEQVNLHIFEPRYKQLINECWENQSTFGIPPFIDDKVGDFGTEMKINEIFKVYPNGEMDIKTEGIRTFEVKEFFDPMEDKLYAGGTVDFITLDSEEDLVSKEQIRQRLEQLFKLLGINRPLEQVKSFEIAHYIGLNPKEEYHLLTIPTEKERQRIIITHLDRILPMIIRAQQIRERMQMNGHFKNLDILDF